MSVDFSSNVLIQNNNITDIFGAGIDLYHLTEGCKIIGNNIVRTGQGIWMVACNNTYIAENTIKETSNPFDVGGWCVHLMYSSHNNRVEKNNIIDNQWGIIIAYESYNQTIKSNNISNNSGVGISLFQIANENLITKNNIRDNGNGGILLDWSSKYNIFKENNIINNKYHASFRYSYPNFWISNYWGEWLSRLPMPIFGIMKFGNSNFEIPWIQFDWHPAKEPYDIPELT